MGSAGMDKEVARGLLVCGNTEAGEAVESRCGQDRYPGQGVAKSRPRAVSECPEHTIVTFGGREWSQS